MASLSTPSFWRLPLLLCMGCLLWLLGYYLQPGVDYAANPLFDGNQYLNIYHWAQGNSPNPEISFPFHSRVLVPLLAALVPVAEPALAFGLINLLFTLLALWLMERLWQKLEVPGLYRWLAHAWFLLHWSGAIKLHAFDPITVDLPIYFFQGLLVYIIWQRKWLHLLWLAPLATLQKESFIALLILLMGLLVFYHWRGMLRDRGWLWVALALLLAIGSKWLANALLPPAEAGPSSIRTILFHAKMTLQNPFDIVRWFTAIITAGGGFLALAGKSWRRLRERSLLIDALLLLTLCYWAFGILAGRDMLRIIFLGFPFQFTLYLLLIKDQPPRLIIMAALFSLPFFRLRGLLPEPSTETAAWQSWYPSMAESTLVWVWLAYGIIIGLALWWQRP